MGAGGGDPVAGTGEMHLSVNGAPFSTDAMTEITPPNLYLAKFPAGECPVRYDFYFSAEGSPGEVFTDPAAAAALK